MKITVKKICDLKFAEYNPRKLSREQFDQLKKSLSGFGIVEPAVINMFPGRENVIIGGHQRIRAAKEMGRTDFPCVEVSVDPDRERELNIRLNRNVGEWDFDLLGQHFDPTALLNWGFTRKELDLNHLIDRGAATQDEPPNPPTEPVSERGDLYEIGGHRLLCGNAVEKDDVEKLLVGRKPFITVTDPPYGVAYQGGASTKKKRVGLSGDHNANLYAPSLTLSPSIVAYVWYAGRESSAVGQAVDLAGWSIRSMIVWHKLKAHYGAAGADYKQKHEPCLYLVRGASNFCGPTNEVSVWEIDQPRINEFHPTQKPVECMARGMRNHRGDVYDPFLGSGTTLIAAEQLGRKCYGLEIDPAYCDVIVGRWCQLTGETKIKRNGKKIDWQTQPSSK